MKEDEDKEKAEEGQVGYCRFSYEVGKQKTISNPTAHATASRQRQ